LGHDAQRSESVAGVMESIVGTWGLVFISAGIIISVLGAYLAWTLMAAEVVYVAAKNDDMPAFLKRTNPREVPAAALLMSTGLIQLVLLITLFSEDAFTFTLKLCSATFYTMFLLFAAGLKFLLLSFISYVPGTILFFSARREQGKRVFSPPELILFVVAIIGAIIGIAGLATGRISI